MSAVMPDNGEVKYLVLTDHAIPYLLARVRWPDVAQAISRGRPDWLEDTGLFDLPYHPSAVTVTFTQAASVAAAWGTALEGEIPTDVPSYIRRMPANWSDLSPSERRAWDIEFVGRRQPPARRGRRPAAVTDKPESVATERRREVRVPIDGRAHIRSERGTLSVGLVDLSESGAGCVLAQGSRLSESGGATLGGPFLLECEANGSRICLDVLSQISWRRKRKTGMHFGLAFAELTKDETEGMLWFLATTNES